MLTYDEAKRLLDNARNSKNGVLVPNSRKARIFWEKDDDSRNRNILVYHWRGRYVSRYHEKGAMWERRQRADEERLAYIAQYKEEEFARRNYPGPAPVVTLFPNGNYMLWVRQISYNQDFMRLLLPEVVGLYQRVILPDGPRPKLRKVPKVPEPRYWPKPGKKPTKNSPRPRYYSYEWALSSWKNSVRGREWYEKNLAKFASLEAWFEAWYKACAIRDANNALVDEWRTTESGTLPIWRGAVFDKDGIATRTSARAEVGRINREKREKATAERKAEQERQRKLRAWKKAVKDASVQKIVEALDPGVQTYLRLRGIAPNPDGTVTLMKFVREDYSSGYDSSFTYTPGTTVEEPNFTPDEHCGRGLHFAATVDDCARWSGQGSGRTKQILCNVDLAEAVVVGNYPLDYIKHGYSEEQVFENAKLKARKCLVLGDGDGTDSRVVVEKKKPRRKTR